MSATWIDGFRADLPEAFEDHSLPPGFDDDWIHVESGAEGELSEDLWDLLFPDPDALADSAAPIEDGIARGPQFDNLPAGHAGGYTPATGTGNPPTDCLAFYLPFHYYHPHWWGIYILQAGVLHLATAIQNGTNIPWRECVKVAQIYLYRHELFHCSTESFATRLEVAFRQPLYRAGFDDVYQRTVNTDDCIEEALADAAAIMAAGKKNQKLKDFLIEYARRSPPGYRMAVNYVTPQKFTAGRNQFAERNHKECISGGKPFSPDSWHAFPHAFQPVIRVSSRVIYLLPRNSPMASRIPMDARRHSVTGRD